MFVRKLVTLRYSYSYREDKLKQYQMINKECEDM